MVYLTSNKEQQQMKARKRSLTKCVECQASFRPHLWGRESGKGPVCDQCSMGCIPDKEPEDAEMYSSSSGMLMDFTVTKLSSADDNIVCANCQAKHTPLWRRDNSGKTICNACGLYYKLHHVHRPATMMRTVIKRRKRCPSDNKQKRKSPSPTNQWPSTPQRKLSFDDSNCSTTSTSSASSTSDMEQPLHQHSIVQPGWSSKFTLPPIYSYYQECNHESMDSLIIQRQELHKEVTRLSQLLSSTVAKLSDIDNAISQPCTCNNDDNEVVARSLLSLASPTRVGNTNGIYLPPISVE